VIVKNKKNMKISGKKNGEEVEKSLGMSITLRNGRKTKP
jgi:hypothetical protein